MEKDNDIVLKNENKPTLITKEMADSIIENREPIGLFYIKEQERFVGIDNSTSEAWVEEFKNEHAY